MSAGEFLLSRTMTSCAVPDLTPIADIKLNARVWLLNAVANLSCSKSRDAFPKAANPPPRDQGSPLCVKRGGGPAQMTNLSIPC
jgi:hypothetical protein